MVSFLSIFLDSNFTEERSIFKEERSALRKHCKEKHNSAMQKFEMNVTGSYSNDAMLRQISEGVRIDQVPEGLLMNSKNEWNYFRVPRAVVARDHVK